MSKMYFTICAQKSFLIIKSTCKRTGIFICRCTRGKCTAMLTVDESICCEEIVQVVHKITAEDSPVPCITEHSGSDPVNLNTHVLQTAYFANKQIHGVLDKPVEQKYRYTA